MSQASVQVFLVDDDEDDFIMIRDLLREVKEARFTLDWEKDFDKAKKIIGQQNHDVYLIDYRLGAHSGFEFFEMTRRYHWLKPMILLTGYGSPETDLEALQKGASDYLVKNELNTPLLGRSIRYAIKRAEDLASLAEREKGFRTLFDVAIEGMFVHDFGWKILAVNEAACQIFGYSRHDMLGTDFTAFVLPEFHEQVMGKISARSEARYEVIGIKQDGVEIPIEISGKEISYLGKPARLSSILDLTQRKNMEAQIVLQDRLASVGLLASGLAHEIGTPMGVIRGRAELLAKQSKSQPEMKDNAEIIVTQIDRISTLIKSLLKLARGTESPGVAPVLLREVVKDVVELLGHELKKHHIEVQNKTVENEAVVLANSGALHQVLLNLLVNAVHAIGTAVQGNRATGHSISIEIGDQDPHYSLKVSDTGCGISKSNLKNLFKPFFTTKEVGVGTGLGLATSYRIVEAWGGDIQVESQLGQGSTFQILLPKHKSD